jgi:hypothetical protein
MPGKVQCAQKFFWRPINGEVNAMFSALNLTEIASDNGIYWLLIAVHIQFMVFLSIKIQRISN